MKRMPEAELMEAPEQARAYARADFSEPHNHFIALFRERFGDTLPGNSVLDLGCGPGDICRRFARAYPNCRIHAVDGSESMLALAREDSAAQQLDGRIEYFLAHLPSAQLPAQCYDILISNSLLHHLNDPATLWNTLAHCGHRGSLVFIMDLLRPATRAQAQQLLQTHAANESDVLKDDFFNSLLAAYRPDEVSLQLQRAGLDKLQIQIVSDRHFIVFGQL